MDCVCRAFCSFLAIALSVSEMATKPRPSRDRPTMTMRLTSNADPRLLFRRIRERWMFFIASPQSHDVGLLVVAAWPTTLQNFVMPGSLGIRYEMQSFVSGLVARTGSVFLYCQRTVSENDRLVAPGSPAGGQA